MSKKAKAAPAASKPAMTQTSIRLPTHLIERADEIVLERGGLLERSDILREALVEGFKVIDGKRGK